MKQECDNKTVDLFTVDNLFEYYIANAPKFPAEKLQNKSADYKKSYITGWNKVQSS